MLLLTRINSRNIFNKTSISQIEMGVAEDTWGLHARHKIHRTLRGTIDKCFIGLVFRPWTVTIVFVHDIKRFLCNSIAICGEAECFRFFVEIQVNWSAIYMLKCCLANSTYFIVYYTPTQIGAKCKNSRRWPIFHCRINCRVCPIEHIAFGVEPHISHIGLILVTIQFSSFGIFNTTAHSVGTFFCIV